MIDIDLDYLVGTVDHATPVVLRPFANHFATLAQSFQATNETGSDSLQIPLDQFQIRRGSGQSAKVKELLDFNDLGLARSHRLALEVTVNVQFSVVLSPAEFGKVPASVVDLCLGVDVNRSGSAVETVNQLAGLHEQRDEVAVLAVGHVEDDAVPLVGLELDAKVRPPLRDQGLVELQIGVLLDAEPQARFDVYIGVRRWRYRKLALAERSWRSGRRFDFPSLIRRRKCKQNLKV